MIRLLAFALGLALASAVGATGPKDMLDAASSAVLKLRARDSDGSITKGSAVLVGPGKLVTNCHVISDAERIEVIRGGDAYVATLQAEYPSRDLCFLHAPAVTGLPPKYCPNVATGQRIFSACFPSGGTLTIAEGRVVALYEHDGAKVIQGSAPFGPGCSGGALLDEQGHLVGITTFRKRSGGLYYFSLPTAWIESAPDSSEKQSAPSAAAFWQLTGDALPAFLRAMLVNTAATH